MKQYDIQTKRPYQMVKVFMVALLLFVTSFISAQNTFINVCQQGADNSGKSVTSDIINATIDSLASHSGGTIFFPAGKYLCGPIELKSNITLYLDAGATIIFTDNFDDYLPMVQSRWEDVRVKTFKSPIYAIDAENIAIKGEGHLEGQGQKWWDEMFRVSRNKIDNETKWQKIFIEENKELLAKNKYVQNLHNFLRPPMIMTYNCKHITIEGISLSNPPFWTIMPAFSENITIQNITIENPGHSPNTDGIDPSSCRNVHISNCHITVGDDCIVIKSGRDEDGREAASPTENITISNCTMLEGHGGVVIGSEMSGNVKRITISNCVFEGTDRGIRLKTMRGRGGIVEDIRVSNITMYNIKKEGVAINMRYAETDPEPISERTPTMKDIHISNIVMRNAEKAIGIYGLEERSVSNVSFSDFQIYANNGVEIENAENVRFNNIQIQIKKDAPFTIKDSKQLMFDNITLLDPTPTTPVYLLTNTQQVKISNCTQFAPVDLYLSGDEKSGEVYLMNNILPKTKNIANIKNGLYTNNNIQ
jgi:polygalacturonase